MARSGVVHLLYKSGNRQSFCDKRVNGMTKEDRPQYNCILVKGQVKWSAGMHGPT